MPKRWPHGRCVPSRVTSGIKMGRSGVPEKVDGPVEWVPYEQKMPLTEELKYFINHLDGKKLKIATGKHGLEVVKILVKASEQILL